MAISLEKPTLGKGHWCWDIAPATCQVMSCVCFHQTMWVWVCVGVYERERKKEKYVILLEERLGAEEASVLSNLC